MLLAVPTVILITSVLANVQPAVIGKKPFAGIVVVFRTVLSGALAVPATHTFNVTVTGKDVKLQIQSVEITAPRVAPHVYTVASAVVVGLDCASTFLVDVISYPPICIKMSDILSGTFACTNAVVAICVVFVPGAAVGAVGVPVKIALITEA